MSALAGFLILALIGASFLGAALPFSLKAAAAGLALAALTWRAAASNKLAWAGWRVLESGAALFLTASVVFFLLRALPGGPFDRDKKLPPEILANIHAKYDLDKPLVTQYKNYLLKLLKGDLGESYKYEGRGVSQILKGSLSVSLQLGIYALLLSFALGIPWGLLSAKRRNSMTDHFLTGASAAALALPSFITGPVLILIFCFHFKWLPPALWEGPAFYILPSFVLSLRPASYIARLIRGCASDILSSDYVRAAWAKGLSERAVFYKHVLKNSFLPVLTLSGPMAAGVLTGSVVVERIFAIQGLGAHFVSSVENRDYPLILGAVLVYSAILIFANLIADLLYSSFDPRIQQNSS